MLNGTLTMNQNPTTGSIQAVLLDTGELAIGGTLRLSESQTIVQLRDWRLTLTSGGQLTGAVIEDAAFVNIYSSQLLREQFQVDGLTQHY